MRRPYDAIIWWEKRRLPFNAIILVIGAMSFGVIETIGSTLVQPGEDAVEPLALFVGGGAFIVGANICYTLGWATELMWSRGDTSLTENVRHDIYRRGAILSAAIAAAPGVLIPLMWWIFGFN